MNITTQILWIICRKF